MVLYSFLQYWRDKLLSYMHRPWYPVVIAFLAAIDLFILIIPTDPLLISAVFGKRQRWLSIAMLVAVGSSLGALILFFLVRHHQSWITQAMPFIFHSNSWQSTESLMGRFGGLAIFLGAVGPLPLQPFVVVAALSKLSILEVFIFLFVGRATKFAVFSLIAASAPELLKKLRIPHKF